MQSVTEQIKDRLQIQEVLGSYMALVPAGNSFKARCPFHNEKTPSFNISPDRGLYYCFGCGAKGDIFTFVQEFEGVDFNGALKILADRAGVELTSHDRRADDASPVYEFLEKTALRYQQELKQQPAALEYLKKRGLTDETIARFRLGYAPDAWRFVADSCKDAVEQKIAVRAGLIKAKDGTSTGTGSADYYDRFRSRIIFPLADSSGRIVGFSGRLFPQKNDQKDAKADEGPKYLNSPETEVFHKSRVLYGFDQAKGAIRRAGFAVLVEGQMDLLMSHQAGFKNTIATSGTAVSEQTIDDDHAALGVVSRLTPHLFLAFDGDEAGQKALVRAALVALKLGMNPKVVPVPDGIDPADFLQQHGAEAWKGLLAKSVHFLTHQARVIRGKQYSPHVLVQQMRAQLFPYLMSVASPVERSLYLDTLAKELAISAEDLAKELERYASQQPPAAESAKAVSTIPDSNAGERISAKDRFAAFAERYAECSDDLKAKLIALRVNDESFGELAIAEDKKPLYLAMIERDFGMLSDDERAQAAVELYRGAVGEFFGGLRTALGAKLRFAEASSDQETVDAVLRQIAAVNAAWQALE